MALFQYFWRFARICKKFAAFQCKKVWWTILGMQLVKLFRNNNKNNFSLICCKFLANLCKSSEILKQYDVKWRLNSRLRSSRGLLLRQKVFFFISPEFYRDHTKIQGFWTKKNFEEKKIWKKKIFFWNFLIFFFLPRR